MRMAWQRRFPARAPTRYNAALVSGPEEQMRNVTSALVVAFAFVALHVSSSAQVKELPNVPVVPGGWEEKFWTHPDGTKFHYFEWGKGVPVILIHGSGGTALNWMANGLGASLAKTNRVLAIDMRGHGQTVGPDGKRQQRTPNMDLDVLAFMDAMGIEKAHIGGFSMGGSITSQIMARAPDRFITAHFGGSGVREEPNSEFAKMIPPDPKGTAPLDAEARRLYEARQKAEAAKAGVVNGSTDAASFHRSRSRRGSSGRRSILPRSNSRSSPSSVNSISPTPGRIGCGARRPTSSASS
jgi:pimeloyl-ACP methyl ester carboxylesterase